MITANDIREVKFSRSMGGYKTAEVDDFLDRCADAVEELTKENSENSRKMQVLAETIMDYRNQEDSIRSALISAQRMSESVITDAKKQAEEIIAAAQQEAAGVREQALADTAAEQEELERVKREVASFKARLMATYREHLTLIGVLEGEEEDIKPEPQPEEVAAPVVEEPVAVQPIDEPMAAAKVESAYSEVPDISAFALDEDDE